MVEDLPFFLRKGGIEVHGFLHVFTCFSFLVPGLWLSGFLVIAFSEGVWGGFVFQKSRNGKMSVVNFARGEV